MDKNKSYTDLLAIEEERSKIDALLELTGWDEEVIMPDGAATARGELKAYLADKAHSLASSARVGELLQNVEGAFPPGTPEFGNVRAIARQYKRATRTPAELVSELTKASSEARLPWRDARQKNDFSIFKPHLERIVRLKQQEAKALGRADHPYDNLMDFFEPDATVKIVSGVLDSLKHKIVALLGKIEASGKKVDDSFLKQEFPIEAQRKVNIKLLEVMGFDLKRGRLDDSVHPFCNAWHPNDVRLTTRYEVDPSQSFYSSAHEGGHGLYEQGRNVGVAYQPIGRACSMGVHESQSRLWENQVARNFDFWESFYPTYQSHFPKELGNVTREQWVKAMNIVEPGMIRVQSDELTYNLHIILRYELELALLSGDLKVADLPGAWNEKMKELLGITPKNDAEGCLQDIHWSGGAFGYFPTYTLGNLYAAQFFHAAGKAIPDMSEQIRKGNSAPLKTWLNKNIHHEGMRYTPEELVKKVTGEPLTDKYLMDYLEKKCAAVYGF